MPPVIFILDGQPVDPRGKPVQVTVEPAPVLDPTPAVEATGQLSNEQLSEARAVKAQTRKQRR